MITPVTTMAPSLRLHLAQLGAMLRYQFRILWRQRRLLVVMLGLAVVITFFSILISEQSRESRSLLINAQDMPFSARQELAELIVGTCWMLIQIVLVGMTPIVVGDVIPMDRQFKTGELLNALPLPTGIYLVGKVLGMCLAAWAALCPVMLSMGALWWALVGPFDPLTYLAIWALFVAPLVLITPGLAVLLAFGQPNRRRGALFGALFGIGSFALMGVSGPVWQLLSPGRPVLFWYFFRFTGTTGEDALFAVLVGIFEVIAAGIGVWAWLRWRNRTV